MSKLNELKTELLKVNQELFLSRKDLKEVLELSDEKLASMETVNIQDKHERFIKAQIDIKKALNSYIEEILNGIAEELSTDTKLIQLISEGNIHREVDHIVRQAKSVLIRNKTVKPPKPKIVKVSHSTSRRRGSRVGGIQQSK